MKGTIAAAILLLSAAVVADSAKIHKTPAAQWEFACSYAYIFYGASCLELLPPKIKYFKNPMYLGFYYKGTKTVFVNQDISKDRQLLVMLHESVHYILDWRGKSMTICQSERAARGATDAAIGIPYNDGWRKRYGC